EKHFQNDIIFSLANTAKMDGYHNQRSAKFAQERVIVVQPIKLLIVFNYFFLTFSKNYLFIFSHIS
ncbi:MAG: hypothetical protein ACK53Y_19500, partial [bacterium]